ncbi:MAG: MFS transporter [Ktedonobacterales bacterium]|nr:MFS transporter [Ktedonobacterales bacterium]
MTTTQDSLPHLDMPIAPPPRLRSLWRNTDYMLLWSGQTVSSIGTGVSGIAFPLLILAQTGDAAKAGYALALRALPYLIFSLPAGALIDRWNRKRVMIICDAGRAIALGSIPVAYFFGVLGLAQLYVVATVEGTLFVFFNIAEAACLPRVVPKEQLPAATGQNQATDSIATLISQPVGGLIYGLNTMLPFVGDAVSYLASVISLSFIKAQFQGERSSEPRRLGVEIREGLSWLWQQKLIRYMAFLTGSANFVFGGSFLIIIVLAQHMGASPFTIGLIGSIMAVGGIVGSIIGATIQRRFSFGQVIIATLVVQAVVWPLQILAPNPFVLGAIGSLIFLMGPIYNVVQFSYRSALIPDRLQGRVNSVFRLLAYGFIPLGGALTGILLQYFDTTVTILVFGVVFVAAAIITWLNPLVRDAKPLTAIAATN